METHNNYTLEKIQHAPIVMDPFPHVLIDNVLHTDIFEKLKANLPDPSILPRYTPFEHRYGINSELWQEQLGDLWGSFRKEFLTTELAQLLRNRFASQLGQRRDLLTPAQWNSTLAVDRSDYELGIHRDTPQKLMTVILYLSGEEGATSGTRLHNEELGFVREVEFKENRMFCFVPYLNTWHSVKRSQQPAPRYTIQTFLSASVAPEMQWESRAVV